MLRVLDLVVSVAVDVVGKEAHGLHIREEAGRIGQVLTLDRGQEHLCRAYVSTGEGLEDIHSEVYLFQLRGVLGNRVGGGAQEVSEVGEYERRHHGVQVYDAQDVALGVEEHVVDLGIAVADALGELALAVQALGLAHLLFERQKIIQDGTHFGLQVGVPYVREMILERRPVEEIKAMWQDDVARFREQRRPYLLYKE